MGKGCTKKSRVTRWWWFQVTLPRLGVDDEAFDDAVAAIDLEQDLDVELRSPPDVEANLAPTQVEDILEVVLARESGAELTFGGKSVILSVRHQVLQLQAADVAAQHAASYATASKVTRKPSWSETRP